MDNEKIYDIAFSIDESLTPFEKKILLERYGSSKEVLGLKKEFLKNILGRKWTGTRFDSAGFIERSKKIIIFLEKLNIKTARFDESDFPYQLKEIPDHPFLIYYRGNIEYNFEKSLAIVGTRSPDNEGENAVKYFTSYLVKGEYTIISGLAAGIDALSHRICLDVKGKTIAVLGCGIDRFYPNENKDIGKEILESGGGIISEYPPGTIPKKWYFPKRNRIIVGLSRGALIVQSPKKSGSLISANLCADYNRDLFVYSSKNFENEKFEGNKMLIQNGGIGVSKPEEIMEEWNFV
jgi:DNA processing protein